MAPAAAKAMFVFFARWKFRGSENEGDVEEPHESCDGMVSSSSIFFVLA
jgi:hypothetical protein